MEVLGREQITLDRSQAYIGVLIDDLVTKESHEPYRMMTSRAEYRLLLRQDNADLRLSGIGHEVGLVSDEMYNRVVDKERIIKEEIERLENIKVGANKKMSEFLEKHGSTPLKTGSSLAELIKRPELSYEVVAEFDENRKPIPEDVIEQININLKYDGYIKRQLRQVEQFKKMENKKLSDNIDYSQINGLRNEAKQKLNMYKPVSIGQASRISGVSPADISVLLIHLEQTKNKPEGNGE